MLIPEWSSIWLSGLTLANYFEVISSTFVQPHSHFYAIFLYAIWISVMISHLPQALKWSFWFFFKAGEFALYYIRHMVPVYTRPVLFCSLSCMLHLLTFYYWEWVLGNLFIHANRDSWCTWLLFSSSLVSILLSRALLWHCFSSKGHGRSLAEAWSYWAGVC